VADPNHSIEHSLKIVWPIVILGGSIGFFLSWLVLSGDQQGRVNLFYLLLVFLIIPVTSILASLFSLIFGKGINLAKFVSMLPLWTFKTKNLIRKIQQLNLDKSWFLMQSQAAAIAFSLTSLLTYFILLMATDLNFVWRSTILEPADIYPLLQAVSWPWSFWEAAQPSLTLLEMTRDSRMVTPNNAFTDYGVWWKFILATQIFYSLFLRILLIIWSRSWIKKSLKTDIEHTLLKEIDKQKPIDREQIATEDTTGKIPGSAQISNWDSIDEEILQMIPDLDVSSRKILINGWQDRINQQLTTEQLQNEQLLIVKAWEPPMGELEDYMQRGRGYLLPLDWDDNGLKKLEKNHFHEWQRFINQLNNWQLYLPEELATDE